MSLHDACMLSLLAFVGTFNFTVSRSLLGRFFVLSLQSIAASIGTCNFPLRFERCPCTLHLPGRCHECLTVSERHRALVFQKPILAFFCELLLTCQTRFLAAESQVWQLLDFFVGR